MSNTAKMTDEELGVRVAELVGWKPHGTFINCYKQEVKIWLFGDSDEGGRMAYGARELPDYCNDLNAMHEIEPMEIKYWIKLAQITGTGGMSISHQNYRIIGHATARQRAEAFVKCHQLKP